MREKQKINAKIKDESMEEEHNQIISINILIKEDQRLRKREPIDYSYISITKDKIRPNFDKKSTVTETRIDRFLY